MSFNEFWDAECTKMEMLALCEKIKKELSTTSAGLELYTASYDDTVLEDYLQSYKTDYNKGLIEAIAGNASGFVSVAEKHIGKKQLFTSYETFNKYLIALKEMGFPCLNSFIYSKLVREKNYNKAIEYLNTAIAQNEPCVDFFQACEFLRKGKKRKGLKILKKIAADKKHPFTIKAMAIVKAVYVPLGCGVILLGVLAVLGVLFFALMFAASGATGLSILCIIGLIGFFFIGSKWDAKYKYSDVKDYLNFDKIIIANDGVLFGSQIDCSGYVDPDSIYGVLGGAHADDSFDISSAGTTSVHQDLSGNSEKNIASVRYIIKQIHDARITNKETLMNMCKNGDFKAELALRILFDTEYRDGQFIVNRQANPCPFIPPTTAKVID